MIRCAHVGINDTAFAYDRAYSYAVPADMDVQPGRRVVVPFGKGDRRRIGIVLDIYDADDTSAIKEICALIDSEQFLNDEQLSLLLRIKDTAMCTYFEALRALIPPELGVDLTTEYKLAEAPLPCDCSDKAYMLYLSAAHAEDKHEQQLILSSDTKSVGELIRGGYVTETDRTRQRIRDKTVTMVRIVDNGKKLSKKQQQVADIIAGEGNMSVSEICYLAGCTPAVIKRMCADGTAETYEVSPDPLPVTKRDPDDILLSEEQQKVYDGLAAMIDAKQPSAALLHGVTGSGKTLVYAKLIDHTLKIGRNVIVLIPEISLTPQTVSRFTGLFGETVTVMHSGLTMSARSEGYKRLRSGASRIAVGTRSAVFAPLDDIGLIIIDEEGERTYRSGSDPRYDAKEIAAQRCLYHGALLLTGSATPSIGSYYSAQCGRTKLFELTERYGGAGLPKVELVDTAGLKTTLSERLADQVKDRLKRGEQSILLLNRRGYHTYVTCTSCKETVTCPNCSIALTYHRKNGRLICHYCGWSQAYLPHCPKCGSEAMVLTGTGTQKLEEELADRFPGARILRMDADTTLSRFAYEKQFTAFRNGEYDIMVGTQMIAKGLDFPMVTLVGVIGIDRSLYAGDFRSFERTFSLITQVVGRSGRKLGGTALIQTADPTHYIINMAAAQDYKSFYGQEIAIRRSMIYPPFCDICIIGFSGIVDSEVERAARTFCDMVRSEAASRDKLPMHIYDP
ncbi:MAG: primosomal protein N', partial [Oscillospiraceae bacterium]|nr:primosomal protein N' [Oscillospiraceae bacterium]